MVSEESGPLLTSPRTNQIPSTLLGHGRNRDGITIRKFPDNQNDSQELPRKPKSSPGAQTSKMTPRNFPDNQNDCQDSLLRNPFFPLPSFLPSLLSWLPSPVPRSV